MDPSGSVGSLFSTTPLMVSQWENFFVGPPLVAAVGSRDGEGVGPAGGGAGAAPFMVERIKAI